MAVTALIQWSDNSTSTLSDVREFQPAPPKPPEERSDHTGKPVYMHPSNRPYVTALAFNIPCHQCSSTVVTNFISHNRDLTKKVKVFDTYNNKVYKGMVVGIPSDFYARLFPTTSVRFGINIAVEQEGTYTGTAGTGATISWLN